MLRGSDLVRHPLRPVLRYTKAILLEIAYGEVSGEPVTEDFGLMAENRPKTLKPTEKPKN